jgi:hypothetical protein
MEPIRRRLQQPPVPPRPPDRLQQPSTLVCDRTASIHSKIMADRPLLRVRLFRRLMGGKCCSITSKFILRPPSFLQQRSCWLVFAISLIDGPHSTSTCLRHCCSGSGPPSPIINPRDNIRTTMPPTMSLFHRYHSIHHLSVCSSSEC